ncbi:multidrug resistance protein, MATE family [Sediminibacillus albus]|uniref:Probable multidrug resistance protein NorM n=2 Tax=Sediminibacillus albus TaxID=407036 RepID=A0A1G9CA56_9BACI|nr:multidrug resistance protein, MATE family [Sediminibacillus albus]
MYRTQTLQQKIKLFLLMLIPILVTQLSLYAMNFFDTVMSGRFGTEDLAGVAIGSNLWVPIFTGINGILLALSPIVSQLIGANKNKEVPEIVRQGIYLSIVLAIIVTIIGLFAVDPILNQMDLDPEVRRVAKYYLAALGSGIIPLFLFNLLRCFIDALGQTRTSMVIILISLPLNILFNYLFIFGKFGIPALGGIGAGIASSLTYWISCAISLWIVHKYSPFRTFGVFTSWKKPSLAAWIEQLRIGVPIGFAIFFETSIFAAVTLLMSVYNTETIAAHQAAINFASYLYMIPLSIAMALTIAVGYEVGGGRTKDAKVYSYIGISCGIAVSFLAGLILYTLDDTVARLYNDNPAVIELTKQFIFYAIFFQFADAVGAPLQGALRGYKDVNITLIMALVSYWLIGLPSGWLLAHYTSFGPFGYWMGIIIGLSAGAITLFGRLLYLQRTLTQNKQPDY